MNGEGAFPKVVFIGEPQVLNDEVRVARVLIGHERHGYRYAVDVSFRGFGVFGFTQWSDRTFHLQEDATAAGRKALAAYMESGELV